MNRIVKLKLICDLEQELVLKDTQIKFTSAYNSVCDYGWERDEKNGVRLHHGTYYSIKEKNFGLVSDLIIQARVKATETLSSVLQLKKKGKKVSKPKSKLCSVRYNLNTYKLNWDKKEVILSTTKGRYKIKIKVPPYATKYIGGLVSTADLIYKKNGYWLYVCISLPEKNFSEVKKVVGIDLGLKNPAVTSERRFIGNRYWKEVDNKYFRIRRTLQSKGTKSARKHLKKLSGKQGRFHRDCDHVISRRIVNSVDSGTVIVMENLEGISKNSKIKNKSVRMKLHNWSFNQLRKFIEYKSEENYCKVVLIDPRNTSKTCSKCGCIYRSNRKSQSLFKCRDCGYTLNADLNAAYNIRNKYIAILGKSSDSGLPSASLSLQV